MTKRKKRKPKAPKPVWRKRVGALLASVSLIGSVLSIGTSLGFNISTFVLHPTEPRSEATSASEQALEVQSRLERLRDNNLVEIDTNLEVLDDAVRDGESSRPSYDATLKQVRDSLRALSGELDKAAELLGETGRLAGSSPAQTENLDQVVAGTDPGQQTGIKSNSTLRRALLILFNALGFAGLIYLIWRTLAGRRATLRYKGSHDRLGREERAHNRQQN